MDDAAEYVQESLFDIGEITLEARARARRLSQYFTPPKLARRIAEWANLRGLRVLEPAAGGGALRRAALEAGAASVDCVELDPRYVEALALEELGTVRPGSFLDLRPADFDRPWDLNLQNPPYEDGLLAEVAEMGGR